MIDFVSEMTAKKPCGYGVYGSFEHLLFLLLIVIVVAANGRQRWQFSGRHSLRNPTNSPPFPLQFPADPSDYRFLEGYNLVLSPVVNAAVSVGSVRRRLFASECGRSVFFFVSSSSSSSSSSFSSYSSSSFSLFFLPLLLFFCSSFPSSSSFFFFLLLLRLLILLFCFFLFFFFSFLFLFVC